jgi:hypothetical protein
MNSKFAAELTAGTNISVDVVAAKSEAASALDPAIAFCRGTPLRNEMEASDISQLEEEGNTQLKLQYVALERMLSTVVFGARN